MSQTPPPPRWFSLALWTLVFLAIVVRLAYWAYTDRTWDDALITVLHSENAASGFGLTHINPGEPPLHGFTSPLSVLIPLAGDLVHVGDGLPLLKFLSAIFGGLAVWIGARICLTVGLPAELALCAGAFLALDHHQILWGMAGMETQVVIVAYLWSIYCMQRGTQLQKGLSFGFVMLARPDGAIWVLIAGCVETWRARRGHTWKNLGPVAAGLALLYLPWLIFTSLYYGSPVPNTIIAKSLGYPTLKMQLKGLGLRGDLMVLKNRAFDVLGPLGPGYAGNGTGFRHSWDHYIIATLMVALCVAGTVNALRKRHSDILLLYAFVWSYFLYLVLLANGIFGWYTAPVAAAAVIGAMYGLWSVCLFFFKGSARERTAGIAGLVYVTSVVLFLPLAVKSDRYIQEYVENGLRKQLGLYLSHTASPEDTVASESLGYVGYYSRRLIYDYPGLCNRTVVRYLRTHPSGRNIISMMHSLQPTYLVLRPKEYEGPDGKSLYPWIERDYELVKVFKVPDQARQKILHAESNIDFEFDVFRAKGPSARASAQVQ
jgi:hypothetical protein